MISAGDKLKCQGVGSYGNDGYADSAARLLALTMTPQKQLGDCVISGDAVYQRVGLWADGVVDVNGAKVKVDFDKCSGFDSVCSVLKDHQLIFANTNLTRALGKLREVFTSSNVPQEFYAGLRTRIDAYLKRTTCVGQAQEILDVLTPTSESDLGSVNKDTALGRIIHTYFRLKEIKAEPDSNEKVAKLVKLINEELVCLGDAGDFEYLRIFLSTELKNSRAATQAAVDAATHKPTKATCDPAKREVKNTAANGDESCAACAGGSVPNAAGTGCECPGDLIWVSARTMCECPTGKKPKKDKIHCYTPGSGGGGGGGGGKTGEVDPFDIMSGGGR